MTDSLPHFIAFAEARRVTGHEGSASFAAWLRKSIERNPHVRVRRLRGRVEAEDLARLIDAEVSRQDRASRAQAVVLAAAAAATREASRPPREAASRPSPRRAPAKVVDAIRRRRRDA